MGDNKVSESPAVYMTQTVENGIILRDKQGKFVKGTQPGTMITKDNAAEMSKRRKLKAQAILRQQIKDKWNDTAPPGEQISTSAEAIGMTGGMLYEQIVLNSEAYPRDRLETYKAIGLQADILTDTRERDNSIANVRLTAEFPPEVLTALVQQIMDNKKPPEE